MIKGKLFKQSFVLLVAVAVLFFISNAFYLQWSFWWFDMLLHFLGGLCVSMGGISIWLYLSKQENINTKEIIFVGLFSVIVIGLIWEIFEVHFSVTFLSDGIAYWQDTASDLLIDISAGIFGSLHSIKLLSKIKNGQ